MTTIAKEISQQKLKVDLIMEMESKVKLNKMMKRSAAGASPVRDESKQVTASDLLQTSLSQNHFNNQFNSYKQLLEFTAEKMLPMILDHLSILSGTSGGGSGTIPSHSTLNGLLPHALSLKEKYRDLKQK